MSRHHASGASGFYIEHIDYDHFRLSWTVDRYYKGSRLRHPIGYHRDTDFRGAVKFAKRHDLDPPISAVKMRLNQEPSHD